MLADQNDIIYDLREKVFDAEKDIENFQNLQSEFDHFFDTSKQEQIELMEKLDRKAEKEKQYRATIKALEKSNAKLREESGRDGDEDEDSCGSEVSNSSSSDSDDGEDGESEPPIHPTNSNAIRGIADADFGEGNESASPHRHHRSNVDYSTSPSSSSGAGGRGVTSKSNSSTLSSPSEVEIGRAVVPYSLKRHLRSSSRKDLKEWVVMLTGQLTDSQQMTVKNSADNAVQREVEDSKERDKTLLLQSIQHLTAELASCSETTKETARQKELVEHELLLKERDGLRTAQSMVRTYVLLCTLLLNCCRDGSYFN